MILPKPVQAIITTLYSLCRDSGAMAGAILGGIMVMIIGFATLVLGNYIIFAILTALPQLNPSGCVVNGGWGNCNAAQNATGTLFNTTSTSITSYVGTVIPIFGLALMVLGFAIILYTLRTSMDTGSGGR